MVDFTFENFFDRTQVTTRIKKGVRRSLSKIGAYVRTSAKTSIRTRKKVAEAGSPPSSHTGLLKKLIFFAYDPDSESVVVGPAKLTSKNTKAPEILERGGTGVNARGQPVLYRKFPFMQPAFEKNRAKFPEFFENIFVEGTVE
ncbi:MAG TPA: hypothetical protein VF595_01135 [Tepidisphaeraceae bacterium]